ncbi:hypothetical protein LTS10_006575 [Elasticomyces elasticus]|nr:hypothetical protein LTS10_006575 [Elasticomyces elasticus]
MGWIPLIIFWLLCIAAVAATSVGAVKIWYRLVTKSLESPYSILGKMERWEMERKLTHYLLTIAPPALSLGWMLFVCIRQVDRAGRFTDPEEWPGHVTLGLSCVWAVLITHTNIVAFGYLMVMCGQHFLGLTQRQAIAKVVEPTQEAAVLENLPSGSRYPHGTKEARGTVTPSTSTASSTQASDASKDTMSGWQSGDSPKEDLYRKIADSEARRDHWPIMPTILGTTASVLGLAYPALHAAFRTALWPISIVTVILISGSTYETLSGILRPTVPAKSQTHQPPLRHEPDKAPKDDSEPGFIMFMGMIATSLYLFRKAKLEMFALQPEEEPGHITIVLGCLSAMLTGHVALILATWTMVETSAAVNRSWRYYTRAIPSQQTTPSPGSDQAIKIEPTTTDSSTTSSSGISTPDEDDSDDWLSNWSAAHPDYPQKEVEKLRKLCREVLGH